MHHPPPLQMIFDTCTLQNQHESGAIRWTQIALLKIVQHTKAMFTIPTIMVLQPQPLYAGHLKLYIWNKPCF